MKKWNPSYWSDEKVKGNDDMYFHVVNIKDDDLNNILYSLKILAQGRISKPPHITLRGPFTEKESEIPREVESALEGNDGVLKEMNYFENENNVVLYFKCESDKFAEVWNKPSFPVDKYGINPHITIYDGNDKEFAFEILREVNKISKIEIPFDASNIQILKPKFNDKNAISDILRKPLHKTKLKPLSLKDIDVLSKEERLDLIKLYIKELDIYSSKLQH